MKGKEPLIEVQSLSKTYNSGDIRLEALIDISCSIGHGEMVAIMGPSGCGKTTLLNCMSGIEIPDQGCTRIMGENLSDMKPDERDTFRSVHMGFLFQAYNLIPVLTAAENVELPLLCRNVKPKVAREYAYEALSRVGLKERARHLPTELSGGQQQRVALARAIIHKPKIIWADEPTGALDRKTTERVVDLIEHLNRVEGITFVIATHDPEVAERTHRILYMDSGAIVQRRSVGHGDSYFRADGGFFR